MDDKGFIFESMECAGALMDSALRVMSNSEANPVNYSFAVMSTRAGIGLYLKSIDRLMDELLGIEPNMIVPEAEQEKIFRIKSKMDRYAMNISGKWFEQQTESLQRLIGFYVANEASPAEGMDGDFISLVHDSWRELDRIACYLYFHELTGYYYGQEWWTGYR